MIPELIFITPGIDTNSTVSQLNNAADPSSHADFKEIFLASIHIDPPIVDAMRRVMDAREIRGIHFGRCTGHVHHVLGAACARGVEKVSFLCDFRRMESTWCQALGRCLRFGKIRKLVLQTHLTNDLAKAMYEGLSKTTTLSTAMSNYHHQDHQSTLTELSVAISHASWQSIVLLSATLPLCTSLKKLSLNRHDLLYEMDEGKLSTVLKSLANHPSLTELCIQGSSCPPGGIHVIAEHLIGSQNCLEKLDLSNHRFGMDRLEGMSCLSKALSSNSSLKFLSLAGHELNDEDIYGLCRALTSPGIKLQELCLNDCQISNEGVAVIAQSMKAGMSSLKALWLNDNPFDEQNALLLVDGLQKNMVMECLLLPLTAGYAMSKVQRQLDFWLFLNRIGRRLLFSNRSVPPFLWAMMLERAVKLQHGNPLSHGATTVTDEGLLTQTDQTTSLQATAIFYLLQHGPVAFDR